MPTARRASMLQPVSKEAVEAIDHKHFRAEALRKFAELGTVLEDTFTMEFIERAQIDGNVLPWGYMVGDEWVTIPDDFVMARYDAFVVPKEDADV
ncbi:hypothetical protein SEA_GAUGELDP_41 [Mycobacterium phage GaugeLDP]|nr:hypothetical protein SEA_GAUGELDP_41 [Mycobacterium phage GaugeLDP]